METPSPRPSGPPFHPAAGAPAEGTGADEAGWRRRFVGGPPRLDEMVELYRALGHEVRLEHLNPDELAPECGDCRLALALFRAVYTRKPE